MLGLLYRIFIGSFHFHNWKILEVTGLSQGTGSTGSRYYLQCTKCGDVKKRDLI